jgi:cytochrome c oxidase cbb3-type subunit 3
MKPRTNGALQLAAATLIRKFAVSAPRLRGAVVMLVTIAALAPARAFETPAASATPPAMPASAAGKTSAEAVEKLRLGRELFAQMNCDGCHGVGAVGWVGPSLVDGRWRYGGDDGAIAQSIREGRPRGMPAYGAVLGARGIGQIVTYLRSLPAPRDVPTLRWSGER